ncbi:hypothetical protein D3C87_1944780 [compost metagenome]
MGDVMGAIISGRRVRHEVGGQCLPWRKCGYDLAVGHGNPDYAPRGRKAYPAVVEGSSGGSGGAAGFLLVRIFW